MKGKGVRAGELSDILESSYLMKDVDGWRRDQDLCTATGCTFVSPTNQVVVAHRGTEGTLSDWGNNLAYGVGGETGYKQTQRYKDAKKLQQGAEEKYGRDNVITTGHSQGGLIARLVGGNSKEVIVVNPASSMFSNQGKNETTVRTTSDAVSYFDRNPLKKKPRNLIEIQSKKTDPIGEHSYEVLHRLGDDTVVGKKDMVFRGGGLFLRRPINRRDYH